MRSPSSSSATPRTGSPAGGREQTKCVTRQSSHNVLAIAPLIAGRRLAPQPPW
jgi:hypothetical protein